MPVAGKDGTATGAPPPQQPLLPLEAQVEVWEVVAANLLPGLSPVVFMPAALGDILENMACIKYGGAAAFASFWLTVS